MHKNNFLKVLCSLPIILITLYFIPFVGVCLILFRFFVYNNKHYKDSIIILIIGLLILIPKCMDLILKLFNIKNIEIPYLDIIINSDIYPQIMSYSKLLITIGIISLILSFVLKTSFNKLRNIIRDNIDKDLQKDYQIRKENDLIMQEKREKAQNTHVIICPYCGSDNILTEKVGTCKFCRRKIE